MTKEQVEKLLPPISLECVQEGLSRAKESVKTYKSRVKPYVPEGYDNATSPEVYEHLKQISDDKEAKLLADKQ